MDFPVRNGGAEVVARHMISPPRGGPITAGEQLDMSVSRIGAMSVQVV